MSENSEQQGQKPDDKTEYLKFIGLLVVMLVVILALAALSPRFISRVSLAILGLDGAPAVQPVQALEDEPSTENAPAAQPENAIEPKDVVEPESAAAPEQAAPAAGVDGVEGLQHEVLPGQTLFQIAELYGLSVQEIAAANNLVNPTQLQPGMILIIPQSQ
jgi:LysM repeat protein